MSPRFRPPSALAVCVAAALLTLSAKPIHAAPRTNGPAELPELPAPPDAETADGAEAEGYADSEPTTAPTKPGDTPSDTTPAPGATGDDAKAEPAATAGDTTQSPGRTANDTTLEPGATMGNALSPAWVWPPARPPAAWTGADNLPPSVGGGSPHAEASPTGELQSSRPVALPRDLGHLMWAELGLRTVLVADDGFEPYGEGDINPLAQLVVAAHLLPFRVAPMTFAVGAEYDVGQRASTIRGQETSLALHRIAGSIVIDATILRHLHMFTRLAPAALYLHGAIDDSALPGRALVANHWTWALDTTGGLTVLLGAAGDDEAPSVGYWMSFELGYSFAGETEMTYAPVDDDEDPRSFGSIRLPNVRPGGAVSRLALGLSF